MSKKPWRRCRLVQTSEDTYDFIYPKAVEITDGDFIEHRVAFDSMNRLMGWYRVVKRRSRTRIVYDKAGNKALQISDLEEG